MRFVHLNYYYHEDLTDPDSVVRLHKFSSGFIDHLKKETEFYEVKHMNYEGSAIVDDIPYRFFRSRNKFRYIPFATHRYIRDLKPDVILTEGFIFPLQVMHLRRMAGKRCIIMAQHQGERPFTGIRKLIQVLADPSVSAYLFTSAGNARPWLDAGIIAHSGKCYEVLSASTTLTAADKNESRKKTGLSGDFNFLWVGRLIDIKDPLTVLKGLAAYRAVNEEAKLFMIYQENDLLQEVQQCISQDPLLRDAVVLLGKKQASELGDWYSSADYFILGSHREGSGYALVEALACGCVPVVTDIPSFRKITDEGRLGVLFEKGNIQDLFQKLCSLTPDPTLRNTIIQYTREALSSKRIAGQIKDVYLRLGTGP